MMKENSSTTRAKVKAETPSLPPSFVQRSLKPSRSVPDLCAEVGDPSDPTGYAAKAMHRRRMVSLSPQQQRSSSPSLSGQTPPGRRSSCATPPSSARSSSRPQHVENALPPAPARRNNSPSRAASPHVFLEPQLVMQGSPRRRALSALRAEEAASRVVQSAAASDESFAAADDKPPAKVTMSRPESPRRVMYAKDDSASAPEKPPAKAKASTSRPESPRRVMYAKADSTPDAARPVCSDSAATASDAHTAHSETTTTTGCGCSTGAGAADDAATAFHQPGTEYITLERADFRQLVISLRNLREQRNADLAELRKAREALKHVCAVATYEAPHNAAIAQAISNARVPQ